MNLQHVDIYVSDHAVLRYLERACGVDLSPAREEGRRSCDDDVIALRYARRVLDIPIAEVRLRIRELVGTAVMLGAVSMRVETGLFVFEEGSVVTFLDNEQRKHPRYMRSLQNKFGWQGAAA